MQTGLSENLDGVEDIPKTSILDRELKRLGVDVAALQETRLANFGSIKERNYTFFWQGLKENERWFWRRVCLQQPTATHD